MDIHRVCYGCFREKDGGVCPHCGFDPENADQPLLALPMGAILGGRYLIGRVLGMGGFGVTYLGYDLTLEIRVAIKEYLPNGIAARSGDGYSMTVLSSRDKESYRNGQDRFLDEARILAKLQNAENIVSVQNFFQENNTAYFVMEYIEGKSLKEYVESRGGRLPWDEAIRLLLPVMDALCQVHAQGLLHRDISPDNIYITKDGRSKLLDFGAARSALDGNKSMSVILKHGFAPPEQYTSHGNQGPWTDIYAMGATLYKCVTGLPVPDAITRLNGDTLQAPSSLGILLAAGAEAALIKALSPQAELRFSNMAAFMAALTGSAAEAGKTTAARSAVWTLPTKTTGAHERTVAGSGTPAVPNGKAPSNKKLVLIAASVLVVALAVILPLTLLGGNKGDPIAAAYTTQPGGNSPGGSTGAAATLPPIAATPAPVATAKSELQTYTSEACQCTVQIPADYEAEESADINGAGVSFQRDGTPILGILCTDYYDIMPVYRIEDIEGHEEALVEYFTTQAGGTDQKLTESEYVTLNERRFYKIVGEYTLDGIRCTYTMWFTDAKGEYGCYALIYGLPNSMPGLKEQRDELDAVIASFQPTGEVKTGHSLFRSEKLRLQAIYTTDLCKGGLAEKYKENGEALVDCVYFYPIAGNLDSLVEVEYADDYASTPQGAMDYLHKLINDNKNWKVIETGEQQTRDFGIYQYLMRQYAAEMEDGAVIIATMASAEIDGETIVFGAICLEEYTESTISLLGDLMRTVKPYAPSA